MVAINKSFTIVGLEEEVIKGIIIIIKIKFIIMAFNMNFITDIKHSLMVIAFEFKEAKLNFRNVY